MPCSLPQETITSGTISPAAAKPLSSTSPIRPISPACEALENPSSPTEENASDDNTKYENIGQTKRKSSTWKTFNLKHQFSKVNMKMNKGSIENNSKRGSIFYYGTTEGTPLSPVEISPDSNSISPTIDIEQNKSDYIEQIEKEIVTSLNELENRQFEENIESGIERAESNSDLSESTSLSLSQSNSTQNICQSVPKSILQEQMKTRKKKERTMSQPQTIITKRVDFVEEPLNTKSLVLDVEGARISRPSDLPLFDDNNEDSEQKQQQPIPPPRFKKKDKRDQRLFSVPNIKYQMRDLRSKTSKSDQQPSTSFTGNFIRRLSKY